MCRAATRQDEPEAIVIRSTIAVNRIGSTGTRGTARLPTSRSPRAVPVRMGPGSVSQTADVNSDGWIDIFLANDQQENQFWMNRGDGTFRNMALMTGLALGGAGEAKADMGVDFGDYDNDGDEDLFITELTGQGSTLYVNDGTGLFEDGAAKAGIRFPSLAFTGFGAAWFDLDNDSWLDVLAVNGPVLLGREPTADDSLPLDQPNQLFRNLGDGDVRRRH